MNNRFTKTAGRHTAAWLLCAALIAPGGALSPQTAEASGSIQAELVRVAPQQTNEVLHNPGMGWVLIDNAIPGHIDVGRTGTYPEVDNVAVLTHWGELEPTEGQYDWTLLDESIDYWAGLGKRIHFRISTDAMMISGYGYAKSVPEWLFQQYGVPYQERFDQGYTFKLPDYTDPVFMQKLETFLTAFADRYRDDPRLDIVDLRGYGTWGEWHSGHDFDSYAERIATLRTIIDKWYDAWDGDKILALSNSYEWRSEMTPAVNNPTSYEEYMSWSAFDHALTKPNLTFRRDGAAGALRTYDRQLLESFFRSNRSLPLIAEFFGTYGYYVNNGSGYSPDAALEEALELHPNFITIMGHDGDFGAAEFYDERPDLIDEGNRRMGYRLVLNQAEYPSAVEAGGAFELRQLWSNLGVGRSYVNYPLKVYLTDSSGNTVWSGTDEQFEMTGFVAGEMYETFSRFELPTSLAAGDYDIRVALANEQGDPTIRLAIAGEDAQKRYTLGTLTVAAGTVLPPVDDTIRETFEGGSMASSDYVGGYQSVGVVTSQPGQTIGGAYSAYGSAAQTQDWTEFLYSDTAKLALEPSTTYTVSFRYKGTAPPGEDGFYYFLARTGSGGFAHDKGFNTWRDESGLVRTKTVTFTTDAGFQDYYLIWGLRNGGALAIDDIVVTAHPSTVYDSFEGGAFAASRYVGGYQGAGVITDQTGQTIGGAYSAYGSAAQTQDWTELLCSDPAKLKLAPATTYTVSFRYKGTAPPGANGFYYFLARTGSGGFAHDKGFTTWSDDTGQAGVQTVTFTTDAGFQDYYLIWGLHYGGALAIDDIVVTAHPAGI